MPLSVQLEPDLEALLAQEAKRLGMTQSAFVQDALERVLGVRNPAQLLDRVRSNTPMGRPDASETVSESFRAKLREKYSS